MRKRQIRRHHGKQLEAHHERVQAVSDAAGEPTESPAMVDAVNALLRAAAEKGDALAAAALLMRGA
jgi:LDH2 family malate/lactate/ureidoglycolate dehydrogenase